MRTPLLGKGEQGAPGTWNLARASEELSFKNDTI